jgi:hypothetical protein
MSNVIMYSMTITLSGFYKDYWALGGGVFEMVGAIHKIDVKPADVEALKHGMKTMPAHPDAEKGLEMLKDARFPDGDPDEFTADTGRQEPVGECRPGSLLRAAVQHRSRPGLQARAYCVPHGGPGT